MKNFALLLIICFATPSVTDAQILNRIIRETKREVSRNVEDMVVEKTTDAIVKRAMRPIEESFDKILEEAFKEDSTKRANNPGYRDTSSFDYSTFSEYLSSLNNIAELPESYSFNLAMDIEVDDGKEKSAYTWHFSEGGKHFALEQMNKKDGKIIVLMDFEREVNVLYTEEKNGDKTAQAIPSMMKLAAAFTKKADESDTSQDLTVSKTGKSKRIVGYSCDEFEAESEEASYTFYAARNFPVTWDQAYGSIIEQFAPQNAREEYSKIEGMVLESISKTKEKDEKVTTMTTKRVDQSKWTIQNSDYSFTGAEKVD
jgi:hypothetical protein